MSEETPHKQPSCTGKECSQCPLKAAESGEGQLVGGRMAMAAAVVFLLPLSLAIAGGLLAGAFGWTSAGGAGIGAVVGLIIAIPVGHRLFGTGKAHEGGV